jgi:peptidyl-prolyl cis-trans isomerase C
MKPIYSAASLLLSLALTTGALAQALPAPAPAPAKPGTTIADRPASSRPLPPDVVVAQGPVELTLTEIDARISRIPPDSRANFINDPERIETLLRNMLLNEQLAREAEAMGIQDDPVVAADIAMARDETLARRRGTMLLKEVKFPNFERLAKERYIASPTDYRSPERITIRNILLARDKHGDELAKKKAEEVLAEIKAKGGNFADYVTKYSDDEPPPVGSTPGTEQGLIKNIERGETTNDFEEAAFALKNVGDLSPVVRTRFGYHIIKLEGRTEAKRYDYEVIKPKIIEELRKEFIERTRQEFVDKTRSQAIDANPELVQSLRTRYLPDGPGAKAIGRFDSGVAAAELEPKGKDAAEPAPGH